MKPIPHTFRSTNAMMAGVLRGEVVLTRWQRIRAWLARLL